MFGKENKINGIKKNGETPQGQINLIGASTRIDGKIHTEGDIRVDGQVEGDVFSNAKVVLGEKALVTGNIYCQNSDVSGKIEGNVFTKNLLHLKAKAVISGRILTKRLVIENGAAFNGDCEMRENIDFDQNTGEFKQPKADRAGQDGESEKKEKSKANRKQQQEEAATT